MATKVMAAKSRRLEKMPKPKRLKDLGMRQANPAYIIGRMRSAPKAVTAAKRRPRRSAKTSPINVLTHMKQQRPPQQALAQR